MTKIYDKIGVGYASTRQADRRIGKPIVEALGGAASVVNVGAGAGSYEPDDRRLIAVDISTTMLRQRPAGAAPSVQAPAESLPLADNAVDAALAILTVHHWSDFRKGFAELCRVASQRVVILTWDQEIWESFWLVRDYLSCTRAFERARAVAITDITSALGPCQVIPVPIPHDCVDGFHGAFWRRPEAYLDPRVRAGISTYASMTHGELDEGLTRLASDIESGAWKDRYRQLLELPELDLGYRLIVASTASS